VEPFDCGGCVRTRQRGCGSSIRVVLVLNLDAMPSTIICGKMKEEEKREEKVRRREEIGEDEREDMTRRKEGDEMDGVHYQHWSLERLLLYLRFLL
jgi:hypothetical protein